MNSSRVNGTSVRGVHRCGLWKIFSWKPGHYFVLAALLGRPVSAQESRGPTFDPEPLTIPRVEKKSPRPIEAADLLAIRECKGLSISPDGKHVVFLVGQAEYATNGYRSAVYVISTIPGSVAMNLGSAGMPNWDEINQWVPEDPKWSRDGQSFTIRMKRPGNESWQVWQWKVGSKRLRQVTHVRGDVLAYEWFPDGTRLFLEVEPGRQERKTGEERAILFDGEFRPWEGTSIVEAIRRRAPPRLTYFTYNLRSAKTELAGPTEIERFSPLAQTAQGGLHQKAPYIGGGTVTEAKGSPDGQSTAYLYTITDPDVSRLTTEGLFIIGRKAARQVAVHKEASYIDRWWWAPDGKTLYYSESRGNGHSHVLMSASVIDGTVAPVFASDSTDYFSSFSMNRQGTLIACLRENNTLPSEIALIDRRTGEIRTLINLNPEFANLILSPARRVEGKNAYGEGWFGYLIKPVNYSAGKKLPLIVTTYRSGDRFLGGASGNESPVQVYAANGFAVLCFDVGRPRNIRRGDFADKLLDWASPVASIEMAVEELAREGVVDPERVGITGFSHGSEIVGYAVTHTTMFRAVVGAGGYDPYFYDLAGNAWHRHFHDWGLGGWPSGEAIEKWKEIAVSLRADRVECPILENVPDAEYLTYLSRLTALGELGKPIEMHVYPDERHVKNQPKNRYEVYNRNVEWFRFWLKDEEDFGPERAGEVRRWKRLREEAGRRGS